MLQACHQAPKHKRTAAVPKQELQVSHLMGEGGMFSVLQALPATSPMLNECACYITLPGCLITIQCFTD